MPLPDIEIVTLHLKQLEFELLALLSGPHHQERTALHRAAAQDMTRVLAMLQLLSRDDLDRREEAIGKKYPGSVGAFDRIQRAFE